MNKKQDTVKERERKKDEVGGKPELRAPAPAMRPGPQAGRLGKATLDYPGEGEVIRSPEYAFRIAAPASAAAVEVRINGGDWAPCRKAAGYWWYDWNGYGAGRFEAAARIRPLNGENTAVETRSFSVELK